MGFKQWAKDTLKIMTGIGEEGVYRRKHRELVSELDEVFPVDVEKKDEFMIEERKIYFENGNTEVFTGIFEEDGSYDSEFIEVFKVENVKREVKYGSSPRQTVEKEKVGEYDREKINGMKVLDKKRAIFKTEFKKTARAIFHRDKMPEKDVNTEITSYSRSREEVDSNASEEN